MLREWGRIGCVGFGGPPTHIRLLRELCVDRKRWIGAVEFEDAIAACNLLPGPASTQLSIFCAWRVRGRLGAVVGGLAFIVPGLIVILALAALFLGTRRAGCWPPARAPVPRWPRSRCTPRPVCSRPAGNAPRRRPGRRLRWAAYLLAGIVATATIGPWVVLVLLACGAVELTARVRPRHGRTAILPVPVLASGAISVGVLPSVAWVAFKVGALSYGGGFVIIPLMQADAVNRYHWMTSGQFLNAVALGQITPGPVVQTVAVVGYAAAGLTGGLLASAVAFGPSFAFILLGARRFDQLRANTNARAFLDGAGPAAIGAIAGSAISLARALTEPWQYVVLVGAAIVLLVLRRGVVPTLLAAAAAGIIVTAAGLALPH